MYGCALVPFLAMVTQIARATLSAFLAEARRLSCTQRRMASNGAQCGLLPYSAAAE
jgi:hypothetical protein